MTSVLEYKEDTEMEENRPEMLREAQGACNDLVTYIPQ